MEEKYTVRTAMRWIVEQRGREVFQKELIINSILADLAAEQENERRKIRLALSSGAGTMFYKMLLHSNGNLKEQDLGLFRTNLTEDGFTEEFADYILNTFLFSVSPPEKPDNQQTETPKSESGHVEKQEGPDSSAMSVKQILELACQYNAIQDYSQVIYLLESVMNQYPDQPEIYNLLGIAYRNLDKNPTALHYYEKALSLNPNNGCYLMNKAIALTKSGILNEAKVSFKKALPILKETDHSKYANALGNYAYALALDGQTTEAVDTLKTAAKLGYKNAEEMRRAFEELGIYYH